MKAKLFSEVLRDVLEYGASDLDTELGKALTDCLDASEARHVKTKLTFAVSVEPDDGGKVRLRCEFATKIPPEPRGSTLVWVTPEGNPSLTHPKQQQIEFEDANVSKLNTEKRNG